MNKPFTRALSLTLALCLLLAATAMAEPVRVYPKTLKISRASATMTIKPQGANTFKLTAKTQPALESLSEKITWSSDNEQVATVDENGLVTAVGEGKTRIRASIQSASRMLNVACKLTVKAVRVASLTLSEADQIVLDPTSASDRSKAVTATVLPAAASFQQVTWLSSDPSVAKVDDQGLVTAVGTGTCTLSASVDGGRKVLKLTVVCRDKSKMVPIVISAGGDIVLGGDKLKKTDVRFEQMISQSGTADYGYVLKNLKKVFEKDDLTILNLECPLKGGGSPRRPERKYNFYGKQEYVNILKAGSVEVANIVNNHISDYGTKPQTKKYLQDAGIAISDGSINAALGNNIRTVKGAKVGFLGIMTPAGASSIKAKARRAKALCDILVVSFHFSDIPERTHLVRGSQVSQARAAVQGGADLVLGHHTHVTSGIELYQGVYIYYGLGSVESPGKDFKYNNFITQQTILWDPESGYTESQAPTLYPICASGAPEEEDNNCQPILLSPSDARYARVFSTIDSYSRKGSLNPAPYNKGTP